MLRHWSQFVPNMSTDIRGHEALHHHHQPVWSSLFVGLRQRYIYLILPKGFFASLSRGKCGSFLQKKDPDPQSRTFPAKQILLTVLRFPSSNSFRERLYANQSCSSAQLSFNTRTRDVYLRNSPSIHVQEMFIRATLLQYNVPDMCICGYYFLPPWEPNKKHKIATTKKTKQNNTHTHRRGEMGGGGGGGGGVRKTKQKLQSF